MPETSPFRTRPLSRTVTRWLVVVLVVGGLAFAVWVSFYLVRVAQDPEVQARAERIRQAQQAEADSLAALREPMSPTRISSQSIETLRAAALAAEPPEESADVLAPDLVDLAELDSTLRFDIRYATTDNFLGVPFYEVARAFAQRPAAAALVRAHQRLRGQGYGITVYDAYRPWYVTKMFWDATPEALRAFVADPANGSRHNRGCALDVTLHDLGTGEPVAMPTDYDDFTPTAYADADNVSALARRHRDLLRAAMEAEGFTVLPVEWWHFDFEDCGRYPILNVPLTELAATL